jgi:DNA-binding CsgD family transcriptional regulator
MGTDRDQPKWRRRNTIMATDTLTPREQAVLDQANAGVSKKDAASALDISMSRLNGLTSSIRNKGTEVNWPDARSGGNGGGNVAPSVNKSDDTPLVSDDDVLGIADEIKRYGRIFVLERRRLNDATPTDAEVKRAEENLQRAQDTLSEAQARLAQRTEQHAAQVAEFESATAESGFSFDDLDERVNALAEERRVEREKEASTDK